MLAGNKTVFFDRDGIVNIRPVGEYVTKFENFRFCEDFLRFLPKVTAKGYLAILITNQQCVGKQIVDSQAIIQLHEEMQDALQNLCNCKFDDIFWCGDLKNSNSYRRKPNPGMLCEAIDKYKIDSNKSYMIGDSISDIEAGKSAGVQTILIGDLIREKSGIADYDFLSLDDLSNVEII